MRTRLVWIAAAVIVLGAATTAYAQTIFTVSATGSKQAGTKEKPKPFKGASWTYTAAEADGSRAPAPDSWEYWWEGVQNNGKKFPTCTAQEIDAVQSDSVCPKKSLVATAEFTAKLGPEGDPNSNVACEGKTVNQYNGGKNSIVWLIVGPAAGCAGVAYLPPIEGTIATKNTKVSAAKKGKTKKAKTSKVTIPLPQNITHPLPGIEGGINFISTTFENVTKGKGKKKVSYMESTGCKGQRDFTFVTNDQVNGSVPTETTTGKCKK